MSLVAMMLRVAAVQALKGATLAGDRVFDSAIDPLDVTVADDPKPFICVYTEDEAGESPNGGRDLNGMESTLEFVLRYAVADRAEAAGEDAEGLATVISIPQTDAGLEVILDLLRRQAVRVLQASPTPFANLWRQLVMEVRHVNIRRGAGSEKGLRFAAREMVISLGTLRDPPLIGPIPPGWTGFLATFRAGAATEPFCNAVADILAKECDGAAGATLTTEMLADLGLPASMAQTLGFAAGDVGDVLTTEGSLDDADRTTSLTIAAGVPASFEP